MTSMTRRPHSKFSVVSLIADHYNTFRVYPRGTVNPYDYLIYVGLPIVAAGSVELFNLKAQNVPDVLAAVAILTGLIFNAVLLVSDLSARAYETSRDFPRRRDLMRLAEELRANISYAVLLGLLLSGLLGAIAMFTDTQKPLNTLLAMVVTALGVQLLLTVLMIVKRVRSVFHGLTMDREERIP